MSTETNPERLLKKLVNREKNTHKGDYGHLALIAGSEQMLGAAILAAKAAFASGVGLVSLLTVDSVSEPLQLKLPELMVYPLKTKNGLLSQDALVEIKQYCDDKKVTVIGIGPGLGRSDDIANLVNKIIFDFAAQKSLPVVVDADAITQLNADKCQYYPEEKMILTPHPGEFNYLCKSINMIYDENQRKKQAKLAQSFLRQVLLLKGHESIVATKKTVFINSTGNPAMATAGSGDVLTGIIASLLAQGLTTIDAACLGCYLHGKSGDIAAKHVGIGLCASDLIDYCRQYLGEYNHEH